MDCLIQGVRTVHIWLWFRYILSSRNNSGAVTNELLGQPLDIKNDILLACVFCQ